MLSIEMLAAGHGDCLLVSYGNARSPRHLLIDGGPFYSFQDRRLSERLTLQRRMEQLLGEGGSLELLVITHIDADHIEGAVKLLNELPAGLAIKEVWFNAWRHLLPQPEDLLGPVQGEMLSALIDRAQLPWNIAFGGGAVAVEQASTAPVVVLPDGMQVTVLSPTRKALVKLAGVWESALRAEGLDPDCPEAALDRLRRSKRLRPADLLGTTRPDVALLAEDQEVEDGSVTNGSSIAILIEHEGKSCLLAGDAHPGDLERAIAALLKQRGQARLRLDAFKLPHHGSKGNLSRSVLDRLDCSRYLISSNGSYFEHPDPQTIGRILMAHEQDPATADHPPLLCFNYRSEQTEIWDNPLLQAEYRYQTRFPNDPNGGLLVEC